MALLISITLVSQPSAAQLAADFDTLEAAGFEPTTVGANEFLHGLLANAERTAEIERLVGLLGHDNYATREEATRRLLVMYPIAQPRVQQTWRETRDAEVRWRAMRVIRMGASSLEANLAAVLRIAVGRPDEFETSDLLGIEHLLHQRSVRFLARQAIEATATEADFDSLLRATRTDSEFFRRVAAATLVKVAKPEQLSRTYELLQREDESLAQATAHALLNRGDAAALPVLVDQLESENPVIREAAVILLRGATGQDFGFPTGEENEEQADIVAAWREWVDENSDLEIRTPVPLVHAGRGDLGGHTLVSTGRKKSVREIDSRGETVWELKIDSWCAERLLGGTTIVCSHREKKLLELDRTGKIIWEFTGVSSMVVEPLASGNFLLADFDGKRVLEINRRKETVWEFSAADKCFDVDRRPGGNTVIACPNAIYEVSPDKLVVNEWKVEGRINGLQVLPNGNFLIANYGDDMVYEMNDAGDRIWKFEIDDPCDAFRNLNGETLIATKAKLYVLREDRETLVEVAEAGYGSIRK